MGLSFENFLNKISDSAETPRTGHFLGGGGGGADALFETVHISKKIFLNYSKKIGLLYDLKWFCTANWGQYWQVNVSVLPNAGLNF